MISRRRTLAWSLPLSLAVMGLWLGAAQADTKPCIATSFKIAQVEAACKAGGQTAAKKMMKTATDKAKAAGEDINCKSCHKDLKTFELTGPDTVARMKKLL